jgi:hypothetical protein
MNANGFSRQPRNPPVPHADRSHPGLHVPAPLGRPFMAPSAPQSGMAVSSSPSPYLAASALPSPVLSAEPSPAPIVAENRHHPADNPNAHDHSRNSIPHAPQSSPSALGRAPRGPASPLPSQRGRGQGRGNPIALPSSPCGDRYDPWPAPPAHDHSPAVLFLCASAPPPAPASPGQRPDSPPRVGEGLGERSPHSPLSPSVSSVVESSVSPKGGMR